MMREYTNSPAPAYQPESRISPQQADEIILGGGDDPIPGGYRRVSPIELRALYGNFMNKDNLHMPMAQYMSIMLDVVRSLTSYKGVHVCKCPLDTWVFQEIIAERKPNVIIEIGNQAGGSTMFLRDTLFNSCVEDPKRVIAIDITREKRDPRCVDYPNIDWIDGDAIEVLDEVKSYISPSDRVMVIDDSSHEFIGTIASLREYGPLVTVGQYFIVEDTILGTFLPFGSERPRAYEAVQEFIKDNEQFQIDRYREKWFFTLNPEGYLEKIHE